MNTLKDGLREVRTTLTQREIEYEKVFKKGRLAYRMGIDFNPESSLNPPRYKAWERGWQVERDAWSFFLKKYGLSRSAYAPIVSAVSLDPSPRKLWMV